MSSTKFYSKKSIALGIATKMTRQTGVEHMVYELEEGFFVAPATKAEERKPRKKRVKTPVLVIAQMVHHSPQYLDLMIDGRKVYVSKNVPTSLEIDEEARMVKMMVPQFYAEKKQLPFEVAA